MPQRSLLGPDAPNLSGSSLSSPTLPIPQGGLRGENRAGLQGMARNKMPASPSGGGAHAMSSNLARGQRNWHQCAGQALELYREALPGQSTA